MLQQIMTQPAIIEIKEVPIPKIGENEVLIRIRKIGICGSDIHVYHGLHPFTSYPVTQGHEASGEVVECGLQVTDLKIGQKVTIEPQVVCGKCYLCRSGRYNLCEQLKVMGFQTTGMASEYFAVDAKKVTILPDILTFDEGAMMEPTAVAVHAVRRAGDVKGLNILVLGAGPIGNLVAQTALGLGAKSVMITDISDYRLTVASECGVNHCINTKNQELGEEIDKAFGEDKADIIYDCAGNNITMGQAIKHARKGSTIIVVAVFSSKAVLDLAVANDHELDIKNTMMYVHEDYATAIQLVSDKKIQLAPLMTKHFSLNDYAKAYQFIEENTEITMKVIIDL